MMKNKDILNETESEQDAVFFQKNDLFPASVKLKKSNVLINSKYKSSLLEDKIVNQALARIEEQPDGSLVAKVSLSEAGLTKTKGSVYQRARNIAEHIGGRYIFLEDKESDSFIFINVFKSGAYHNGVMLLRFNEDLKPLLVDIRSNYTTLNTTLMNEVECVYAYRLYEIVRSHAYARKGEKYDTDRVFDFEIGLAELMVTIGMIDTNADKVKPYLSGKNPDYEMAIKKALDKRYTTWSDFRRHVLDKACTEINEKMDIEVEYDVKKGGVGAKVQTIIFHIRKKDKTFDDQKDVVAEVKGEQRSDEMQEPEEKTEEIAEETSETRNSSRGSRSRAGASKKKTELSAAEKKKKEIELLYQMQDKITEDLTLKEMQTLITASDYDFKKIMKAYKIAKNSTKPVRNLVGFMLTAMADGYEENPSSVKAETGKNKKNTFHNFEERDDDYEDLMKAIRKKNS